MTATKTQPRASFAIVTVVLPGPDRKRKPAAYQFNVTYRNPVPTEPGCVMTWNVTGGREEYQVAAERTADGHVAWHCTCPDAIYHSTYQNSHSCKHVQGLLALLIVCDVSTSDRPRTCKHVQGLLALLNYAGNRSWSAVTVSG